MIGTVQEGRYRILEKIGEGGQGEVYLAEHLLLGRSEALKVLKEKLARDENFVSRFRREARVTNRVQHPNIVGVYDFGRLPDGRYFLAMEYVDGERLDAAIAGAPLPVARAVRIASQLARALAHAHGLGVVHRDLKPANLVLVQHRGQADFVKVLDFGMAKILEGAERESLGRSLDGQMFGTAPYMAPEQFYDRSGADPQMDVYGAGCILMEMLTGRPPFAGGMVAQMEQHLRAAPELPSARQPASGISPALDALVLRCLAKRPSDRFAGAAALADALDALPAPPPTRRTLSGVQVPRLDDFGGDTETGSATDPGAAPPAPASPGDPDAAAAIAEEVAEALVDAGAADAAVVAGAAQLREQRRQVARLAADAAACEARAAAYEQGVRERVASLAFAVGELSFDPDPGHDVVEQIAGLQASLAAVGAESRRELAALDDEALGLAAALHDAREAHVAACRRLLGAAATQLERRDPGSPLRRRVATARSLLPG